MNIVLCTGVMRSASTWSFNVCRAIIGVAAQRYGITPLSSYLEGDELDQHLVEHPDSVAVFKTHRIGEYAIRQIHRRAVKNVCTLRDPRDCVASRQQFKDETLQLSIDMVNGSFRAPRMFGWESLFLDYERIMADPVEQVLSIMAYLGLQTTQDRLFASAVAEELSMEKMAERTPQAGVNPEWELHSKHINGGDTGKWKSLPDPERVEQSVLPALEWYREHFPTGGNDGHLLSAPQGVGLRGHEAAGEPAPEGGIRAHDAGRADRA